MHNSWSFVSTHRLVSPKPHSLLIVVVVVSMDTYMPKLLYNYVCNFLMKHSQVILNPIDASYCSI